MTRIAPAWFDGLYRSDPDPWGFQSRWYERRKFDLTVACLPEATYDSAFEAGCSIGVLTESLAGRCRMLVAADASAAPLEHARARLAHLSNVECRQLTLPEQWPCGPFDLVVLSEIGYYFDETELTTLVAAATASMRSPGDLIAVHWRGVTNYPQTGDQVHAALRSRPDLTHVGSWTEPEFLIDVFRAQP